MFKQYINTVLKFAKLPKKLHHENCIIATILNRCVFCSKKTPKIITSVCSINEKSREYGHYPHSVKRENKLLYYNYNRTFSKIIINYKRQV